MDTRRLDLNLLITLEALLSEQNVTKAAARLHLSQPAVSAQLGRLRDMFDDPLLIPAHRGMTPSAKAAELLGPLREALDRVRAALAAHQHFEPSNARLTVCIASTDYLQAVVLVPALIELRRLAPGIRIALRALDLEQLEAQMVRGEVDLALMTPASAPPSLRARALFDEHYVLIGRQNHPQLRSSISAEEYGRLEHVVVSLKGGEFGTPVDPMVASLGLQRRVVVSAASFLLVPDIVAASDYVALVPSRLLSHRAGPLLQLPPPLPVEGFSVGMVWHERNHGHGGHRWVREKIASMASASGP